MHCLFRSELLPVQKFLWAEWEILHLSFKFLLCFLQAPLVNLFTPNSANSKQFAKKKEKKIKFQIFLLFRGDYPALCRSSAEKVSF